MQSGDLRAYMGFFEAQNKLKTCDLIFDLSLQSDLPWLIGGDLNEVLYNFEKNRGSMKPQSVLEAFNETLESYYLHNLGYVGINIHGGMAKMEQVQLKKSWTHFVHHQIGLHYFLGLRYIML